MTTILRAGMAVFATVLVSQPDAIRAQAGSAARPKAFVGATVIDSSRPSAMADAVLVVRDGRIEASGASAQVRPPADAEVVDLKGKFLIPGLISAHVHISDVQGTRAPAYTDENTLRQLGVFARYGITSVWSLGGEQGPAFAARDGQTTPSLSRARLYVAGDVIVGSTPEEARAMVTRVAALKPDVIKIRVDDNLGTSAKMRPEVFQAVIDEAHRRGLRVAAHIFYLDDAKALLRAGVDAIVHSVRDREIDEEFLGLMKSRAVPYCPTLTREISTFVYEATPPFFSDPFFLREADRDVIAQLQEPKRQEAMRASKSAQAYKAGLDVAKRNLKKAADAGVIVAMGTDAGPSASRFQGYFEHLEMEMMQAAGLSPDRILRAATGDAARTMKVEGIGSLGKGAWADFVVLDNDPRKDIRQTRSIASVWIAGNRVQR
jgi:imidazolonepropionase-like amidohydrolase